MAYKNLFNGYIQESAECNQVIYGRQCLTLLPFVDGPRFFKPEPLLEIFYRHPTVFPQTNDILACLNRINDRKSPSVHVFASFAMTELYLLYQRLYRLQRGYSMNEKK
jgi:hypothetical protein